MSKLREAGDTIVEVLISIAVVSLILGGAFATTRRSQTGVQNSQEHAQALKLIQSQLEQLRADAASASPTVFTFAVPFCMYNNTAVSTAGATAGDCRQDGSGAPTSAQPTYQLTVNRSSSNGGYLFSVQAAWTEIDGKNQGNVSMVYRLYQ